MTTLVSFWLSLAFYTVVAYFARWAVHGMVPTLPLGSIWYWIFGTVLLAAFYNTLKSTPTKLKETK
jgi:hypothetical protein